MEEKGRLKNNSNSSLSGENRNAGIIHNARTASNNESTENWTIKTTSSTSSLTPTAPGAPVPQDQLTIPRHQMNDSLHESTISNETSVGKKRALGQMNEPMKTPAALPLSGRTNNNESANNHTGNLRTDQDVQQPDMKRIKIENENITENVIIKENIEEKIKEQTIIPPGENHSVEQHEIEVENNTFDSRGCLTLCGKSGAERWRKHKMTEDYISLVGKMMLPTIHLPPFGYDAATGHYPIERVTALGILLSPLRRPTVIEKWSPYEISVFEASLALCGKEFHQVQKFVKTKSTKEIIEFYYVWKKTEHYKVWKKQYVTPEMEEEFNSSDYDD